MNWLARLKNQKVIDTHATKPTKPPRGEGGTGFVGFVAHPLAPYQKCEMLCVAANDHDNTAPKPFPAPDPDRYCWPHSTAMNTVELDTFTKRLARFTDKGMGLEDAELMADKMVKRDRTLDDRRVCLECTHLAGQSGAVWHCKNWMSVGVASKVGDARLTISLVLQLKRCDGFTIHV